MEQMSEELINRIEKALDITFYKWQRKYLLNEPMLLDMRMTGRCTGKTFVYVIKQLFENSEPLLLRNKNEILDASDWWYCENRKERALVHPYLSWYRNNLKDIYIRLNEAGITTRKVILKVTSQEVDTLKHAAEKEIYSAFRVPPELFECGFPNKESAEIQLNQFLKINKTSMPETESKDS